MKQLFAATAGAILAMGMGSAALADNHAANDRDDRADQTTEYKAKSPQVIERDAQGKATKIKIGEKIYDVCMSEAQDGCINPRAAGLDWGDRPLDYWPGETDKDS